MTKSVTPKENDHLPSPADEQTVVERIAARFFLLLCFSAATAAVIGFPLWRDKRVGTFILLFSVLTTFIGWRLSLKGKAQLAMHAYVLLTLTQAIALMAISEHSVLPTLLMLSPLPSYAAVCGLSYALAAYGVYTLAEVGVGLAPLLDISIPKVLSPPEGAELVSRSIAMFALLVPAADALHQLRRSLAALSAEATRRAQAEADLQRVKEGIEQSMDGIGQLIPERMRDQQQLVPLLDALSRERVFLKTLIHTIPDLVWLKDPEGIYLSCNHQFEKFFGHTEKEIVGKTDYDFLEPTLAEFFRHHDRAAMTAGHPSLNEEWITYAVDGKRALLETTKTSMVGKDGRLIGVLGVGHDITEAYRQEQALRNANRALRALSESAGVILQADDEQTMLHDVCQKIVQSGEYHLAWIGFCEQDEQQTVRPMAVAEQPSALGYVSRIRISWGQNPLGLGPTGRAIRERRTQIAHDTDTEQHFAPWRQEAQDAGIRSSLATPLLLGDQCIGAFMVYSNQPEAFTPHEAELVEKLAGFIAFGIASLRERVARSKAEQALRSTSEQLAHLLKLSPSIVYQLRYREGTLLCVDVSESITRILGYSISEALAPGWWETHLHPEDRARVLAEYAGLPSTRWIVAEFRIAHKEGHYLRMHDALHLICDAAGNPSEAIGAWIDVTQLRHAEQQLRDSEARFRHLFEDTKEAITILEQGVIVDANRAALELFQRSSTHPLLGLSPDVFSPVLQPSGQLSVAHFQELMLITLDQGAHQFEWTFLRPDGEPFFAEALATSISVGEQTLIHLVWRDITKRKRAEEMLVKLSMAVEQSPESIVITNLNANIEYVNTAFLEASGYSRQEVLGRNPRVLQSGRTPKAVFEELWTTLLRGQTWKGELWNCRKDGTEYLELAIIAPIRSEGGRISHYLAVKEDITENKRIHEELMRHRYHLEELVRERTLQLADARERAEAANRAKSAFLANMSHEIRTPMNAIIGLSYLMQQEASSPVQRERLGKVNAAAKHLLSLIEDILDLSKVEAGKLVLDPQDFDPRKLVEETAEILRNRAEEKGLILLQVLDSSVPSVLLGDVLRVRQILLNLGSNAVKFTDHGRIVMRMSLRTPPSAQEGAKDAARVWLRFEVSDSGIGLTDEQKQRLFQAFEQADSSITRRFGGTGLGLAICRRLVELMGGVIGVESHYGHGSVFWFELPFEVSGVAALLPFQPGPPSGVSLRDLRVLLVEDDAINQVVAQDILVREGVCVTIAHNGLVALELASRQRFDLILMDLQMPGMDGLTATQTLRTMPGYEQLPIIAMTANVFGEDRQRCMEAGMNDFIGKPFEPELLVQHILRWIQTPGSADVHSSTLQVQEQPKVPVSSGLLPPLLSSIAGLNAAEGLHRLQGNTEAYVRLLQLYASGRAGDVSILRQHLAEGAFADALRVAHTLKGASATLGAFRVQRAARAVEEMLRQGGFSLPGLEGLLAILEEAQADLVAQLQATRSDAGSEHTQNVDPAQLSRQLQTLEQLLKEDDVRAGESFQALRPSLPSSLDPLTRQLQQEIESYQFEQAETTLQSLREALLESMPALS